MLFTLAVIHIEKYPARIARELLSKYRKSGALEIVASVTMPTTARLRLVEAIHVEHRKKEVRAWNQYGKVI